MSTTDNISAALEPLLSVAEARHVLGISEAGIYRLFARGELEVVEIAGRRLIEPDTLRAFIAERRRTRRGWERPRGSP